MDRTFYGNTTLDDINASMPVEVDIAKGISASEDKKPQMVIGEREVAEAQKILTKYKDAKANLESRIVEDELWWELRHWEALGRGKDKDDNRPRPTSGWLFNTVTSKHADAMDNIPEPVVLPREKSDEESAKTLSSILPVVMEQTGFEDVYDAAWWEKLKHGTACYGVFWNSELENGLGQIEIKTVDLLRIFYEPGITDIQDSRNLFIVDMVDKDLLENKYPDLKGKLGGDAINVKEYIHQDNINTSDKALLVDWYYKVKDDSGLTKLHFCKFCGDQILYASENDPAYAERGFYDHGLYPIVLDCLYPEKSQPIGFGLVAIAKDPQMYIDLLSSNILESSMMGTKSRFFISNSTGINETEFLDWSKPLVHVEGELGEERIRSIQVPPISPVFQQTMEMKINEMKETSSNRDINSGGSGSVTAAASIAALQESGNKTSRDILQSSYRAYSKIVMICIELMRQFYDESRSFRITGKFPGQYEFVDMSNLYIQDQPNGQDPATGEILYRKPIFDLKIKAQKKSPFSRMEMNERAKELYGLGFFNPENAQSALNALEMMDFEGIEKVKENVRQGQTLLNMLQQANMVIQQQNAAIASLTGQQMPGMSNGGTPSHNPPEQNPGESQKSKSSTNNSAAGDVMRANTPMTSYGERLAKRSSPDMNAGSMKDMAQR